MKKASKLTILSASMLLAACSSAQKPAQVIEPMLEETIVIPTNTPTVGSSVSQSGKKRASKQQANRQMNNNQRRVVQVTSVKRAEQGVLVDIQEGKVKGVHNVNIGDLPSGIYHLMISQKEIIIETQKIIKL